MYRILPFLFGMPYLEGYSWSLTVQTETNKTHKTIHSCKCFCTVMIIEQSEYIRIYMRHMKKGLIFKGGEVEK